MSLIQQLDEARYYGQDERWFHDAISIAKYNIRNADRKGISATHRMEEKIYWQDYADWLTDHKKELQTLYNTYKNDRNTYLDHLEQAGMDRLRHVEVWADTIDPSEYPEYSEFHRQTDEDPRPEHARHDYLQYVTNTMIDNLTHPQGLNEAKYASGDNTEWQEILDIVKHYSGDLKEFVKNNEKILKELFKTVKGSFRMFHDMTYFYIEDNPEEYDEEDKDPQKIAAYWWDMFPMDLEEEPLWQQATTKFGGPLFGDVIQIFGEYITQNAERIAQFDQIYEAQYIKQDINKRLPNYWKFGDQSMSPQAHRVLKNPKVKHKGSGAFASTYQHADRPHDVTKITKPMEQPDGYQKYLKMLLQHEDRDNPHFPKIRDVKERRKGSANTIAIRMENLHDIETITRKEADFLLNKWLGENRERVMQKIMAGSTADKWKEGVPQMLGEHFYGRVIVKVLRQLFNYYEEDVVDKNLSKALKWLKYAVATDNVDLDLGDNNVMVRRTPYGPQIVFTDPVA